ncbi:MAG: hypothetical protein M4579_006255 [Chaenotheca gracillima]|nr:MAG: hypothetical protein M4579_006255 [Chaenotheca gracillima]
MVTTCSPHRSAGGTLHFPSPTHPDAASALRSLRRSLSRSPSSSRFNLVSPVSTPSPKSPRSPSPLSPRPQPESVALFSTTPAGSPSPSLLAVPYPPSAKINRSSLRRANPMRSLPRARTSPNSPARRPLALSRDDGNGTPSSPAGVNKHRAARSVSPVEKHKSEKDSRGLSLSIATENMGPNYALSRMEKSSQASSAASSGTSSPLKRSDGIMNLDQASLGSPVAKRRSLHGVNFGDDFNVFELGPSVTSSPVDSRNDAATQAISSAASQVSPLFTSMPKRSSSLRKSTLQQRHIEKPSFPRRGNADLAMDFNGGNSTPRNKHHRMSVENYLPPMARDSPFASQGGLPNASAHPLPPGENGSQGMVHPHPLSRTLTQSSSGSFDDLLDDSPTRAPLHHVDPPKVVDFSKSLPLVATRPFVREQREQSSSTESSYMTPHNYKSVKPLPAAFMSTGLISKRNRNPEQPQAAVGVKAMPDTPCKRPTSMFDPLPMPGPGNGVAKAKQVRHEFGTPSTPFNPHSMKPPAHSFGKGVSVFGSNLRDGRGSRRSSFASIDGNDNAPSPTGKTDSQSTDYDLPPTPTKHAMVPEIAPFTTTPFSSQRGQKIEGRVGSARRHSLPQDQCCKLPLIGNTFDLDGDGDSTMDESPLSLSRARRALEPSSPQLLHHHNGISPSPASRKPLASSRSEEGAKLSSSASPLEKVDLSIRLSPRTPRESFVPPDPSGLSISGQAHAHDAPNTQPAHDGSSSVSSFSFPPATPTASRGHHSWPRGRRPSVTPIHGLGTTSDVDSSLSSRFEKVELIGTGEFSQVYRVTQAAEPITLRSYFPSNIGHPGRISQTPLATPMTDRVFAVKKTRHPYVGTRDRFRKRQEAEILESLGRADHVVHLIDSWEDKNHLYIQTEFCEEGSLDLFLAQVGRKARLDDFRIWKILLETCMGLKHVHDAGFIHLDLKPANILITFEGVLKIGDFGMATCWPAAPGIEGEGDREYIGPEILMGQFDKPADIFALGLIMLEIAGNVELPDNGPSWQKLRSGDMSDVPSLTWSSGSRIFRDSSGNPLSPPESFDDFYSSEAWSDEFTNSSTHLIYPQKSPSVDGPPFSNNESIYAKGLSRQGELLCPPPFMRDSGHEQALDRVVRWMISPSPVDRPVVGQILDSIGARWAETRRRAGATVFEGNWGPADDVLALDAEMVDV